MMKLPHVLPFAAGAAALVLSFAGGATADEYPSRTINLIVPHAAGSTADVGARIVADQLQAQLGQPIVVDNRPGAGSIVGTQAALNEDADGYTLILVAIANTINQALRDDIPFDIREAVIPISQGWTAPNVGVIHPSVGVSTLEEFVALARESPGALNYATSGVGTSQHFAGELLKMMAGIEMEHIPYNVGAQSVSDALGGAQMIVFNSAPMLKEHVESGALLALGVTSNRRSPVLPDVPTFEEAGFEGYNIAAWWGFAVKQGTADDIVQRLSAEIQAALSTPEVVERFAALGASASPSTPEEFAEFIRGDVETFETLVNAADISVE